MHATTPAMAARATAADEPRTEASPSVLRRLKLSVAGAMPLLAAVPARASDQLELTPDPVITGILLVAFALIIAPLNSLIFRPLLRVMDERTERIAGARNRAGQVEVQADEALARYEDSIRTAHEGAVLDRRQQIESARAELLQTTRAAKAEAERELERAREELQASIGSARDGLRESASELAQTAAESVLGRSLS
jgi:F-type H+-transporting ATPase subunit b